jgi:hypothetical protein
VILALSPTVKSTPVQICASINVQSNNNMLYKLSLIFRSLRRQKGFTALNFTGLYVSITIGLLIGLLLFHERSFDNFHKEAGNIYRVVCQSKGATSEDHFLNNHPFGRRSGSTPRWRSRFSRKKRVVC